MAQINTVGFDAIIRQLEQQVTNIHGKIPIALDAGADVLVQAQKNAVPVSSEPSGHSEHLRDHICKGRLNISSFASTIEVYPDGIRDDGQRFATVAFVLEYGKSNQAPNPWMRNANRAATKQVQEAMKEVLLK